MPTAPKAFDAHAGDYDALRRRLVPVFDAFYAAAIGALSLAPQPVRRVLDLGAGKRTLFARIERLATGGVFVNAELDCFFKHHGFAVIVARRSG